MDFMDYLQRLPMIMSTSLLYKKAGLSPMLIFVVEAKKARNGINSP